MDSPLTPPDALQEQVIVAKSVYDGKDEERSLTPFETLVELCQRYPAYTLKEARKIPHKHVLKMIKLSRQKENSHYLMQLRIVTAPHTKEGKGISMLMDELIRGTK